MSSADSPTPLLSIVTVCFENPQELSATLVSCEALPEGLVEIIVIDGSNSLACSRVVQSSARSVQHYIHEPDRGIYDAMNKGVRVARGEGVLMLNSGDILRDAQAFSRALDEVGRKLGSHVIFGRTIDDFSGTLIERSTATHILPDKIRRGELPSHQSTIVPTWFSKAHPYDERLKVSADTAFLRQAFTELPTLFLDEVVSVFSYGGCSNRAPNTSQVNLIFRENIAARDLTLIEKIKLYTSLWARWGLGAMLGESGHRRLQTRRAINRAKK